MKPDPKIQTEWWRLLKEVSRSGDIKSEKLGEGYYAVAHRPRSKGTASLGPAAEYATLRNVIPNFDRTRAVPLNFRQSAVFGRTMTLRSWAGQLADGIESGVLQALAVVDAEAFEDAAVVELRAAGWQVEVAEGELRVTDGVFVQRVNLLRVIVEMATSRSSLAQARRALRENVARDFRLYRKLFRNFARRFQEFEPAVLDHYFTAYTGACCVSAGWDYWQVSGRESSEAESVFECAMEDFKDFVTTESPLVAPTVGGAGACERETVEN